MKLVSYAAAVAVTLAIGCAGPPPPNSPPSFGRGDIVAIDGDQVGVVMGVAQSNPTWRYSVLFRDRDMQYNESSLKLVERANWNRKLPKAEVDGKGPIHVDPK